MHEFGKFCQRLWPARPNHMEKGEARFREHLPHGLDADEIYAGVFGDFSSCSESFERILEF
ncbi:MAG: hypothetical protein CV090_06400 [Nitrospira sp. WS238]|nr:hypothetical protein [Nitrospira sp. WS238]